MSNEELSRKIAEFLEPNHTALNFGRVGHLWRSPLGLWELSDTKALGRIVKPRDMVGDPAMTVMLWKKLLLVDMDWRIEAEMQIRARKEGNGKKNIDWLQRAVADAFLKSVVVEAEDEVSGRK
jgi:hypothetical protein